MKQEIKTKPTRKLNSRQKLIIDKLKHICVTEFDILEFEVKINNICDVIFNAGSYKSDGRTKPKTLHCTIRANGDIVNIQGTCAEYAKYYTTLFNVVQQLTGKN